MNNRKKILFLIFSIFIGSLFVVVLSEGILRILGPKWLKQRVREVGVRNVTGVEGGVFGSDKDWPVEKENGQFVKFTPFSKFRMQHYEFDVEVNIDKWGGRSNEKSQNADDNIIIPFLGDSFTFGVGVKDDETYVSLLSKEDEYSLINLGVPGSCIKDQLYIIEHRHKELSFPKIYIFNVFVGNDLTNLLEHASEGQEGVESTKLKPLRDKKSTKLLQHINDFVRNNALLRKIYFIQFLKSKFLILYNNYRVSLGVIPRMDYGIFHVIRRDQHFQDMEELFNLQLERTKQLSELLHFQPIFILIPDMHQVDKELREDKYKYYGIQAKEVDIELVNKSIKLKLDQYKMPYVDVLDCLREKYMEPGDKKFYYVLDAHLTREGHQAVYACMANEMDRLISTLLLNESNKK